MEIIIGKNAGFCFGVKRAVEGSLNEVTDKKVYCLGELVHNNEVIKRIEEKGIKVIDSIEKIVDDNSKIIIRAHGIKKEIYDEISKRHLDLIDYTCPFVLKIHDIAQKYRDEGYFILVVGSKMHPEIIGTISYCGNNSMVIEDKNDLSLAIEKIMLSKLKKVLLIVQTTYSEEKFMELDKKLKEILPNDLSLVIKNTICNATSVRQKEVEELSKKVDLMIIIGGKNSSNTKKLYEISSNNVKTLLVENKDELEISGLKNINIVGIMAGASTPYDSINEIVEKIKKEV